MKYQQGDILIDKDGDKRKILGVCGELYFISLPNDYKRAYFYYYTEQQLDGDGYTLEQAEWVPKKGEWHYFVSSRGCIEWTIWVESSTDLFRLSVGNVHRTQKEAEAYLEKMKSLKK